MNKPLCDVIEENHDTIYENLRQIADLLGLSGEQVDHLDLTSKDMLNGKFRIGWHRDQENTQA